MELWLSIEPVSHLIDVIICVVHYSTGMIDYFITEWPFLDKQSNGDVGFGANRHEEYTSFHFWTNKKDDSIMVSFLVNNIIHNGKVRLSEILYIFCLIVENGEPNNSGHFDFSMSACIIAHNT